MDGHLAEFRAEASDTQQLSELEEQVIKLLTHQIDVPQEKLAYHLQHVKVESAVPLGFLASDAILHGTRTRDDNNSLWAMIQAATAQQRQFCVQHRIGIYFKNWMDASLPKK